MLRDYNPKCSIFGALIGGAFNAGTAALNNEMARQREAEARAENYRYGEMQAANADARTRALYNDLQSPQAIMRQIKEAGLSPSLMYGGGMSGSVGQGAQAPSAAVNPTPYGMSALEAAQIGLINAQTEKTQEEAKQVAPTAESVISKNFAEAGAAEASKAYTEMVTRGQELQNYITENTAGYKIAEAKNIAYKTANDAEKALYEAEREGLQFKFDKETFDARVDEQSYKNAVLIADAALKESNKKLSDAEREKVITETQYIISKNLREWHEIDIAETNSEAYVKWVDESTANMRKELEIQGKRLGIEKTRVWTDLASDIVRAGSYALGAQMMMKNGVKMTADAMSKQLTNAAHTGKAANKWLQ